MINYNNRFFRGVANTENGEVSGETLFHYEQRGPALSGTYGGGAISRGHLMGTVNDDGTLDFVYHHVNTDGVPMAGRCHSTPRHDSDGRLVLDEQWQWFSGDRSAGTSAVAEVAPEELAGGGTWLVPLREAVVQALESQYSAALSTLAEAVEFFTGPRWKEDHPDGSVDRVVFHTLFFTDYYLGSGSTDFRDQAFHSEHRTLFQDYEELQDREPQNHYDRDLCMRYLEFCRGKATDRLAGVTEPALADDSGFEGRHLSRLALHIYTVRHIQHHAAQLGLRKQLAGGSPLRWHSR